MRPAVSAFNADPGVRGEQAFAPRVILNDCTLREGEQASEVNFTLDARLRIAEALYEAGIAQVQAGYAGRSATDFRTIVELRKRFPSWTVEAVTQVFQKDWREQIDLGSEHPRCTDASAPAYMRLDGPNLWPAALPELQGVFNDWAERCTRVAQQLMRAWAVALGSPADVFDPAFGTRPSTLIKLVRYPGRAERGQGVGAHKDPGVLTMLMIEPGKAGLQVLHGEQWIDVPPLPDAFVINIGELLEYATDGYLKATLHRVVAPPAGEERLSIPFFFNPALDSTVPRIALPPALARAARGLTRDPANVITGTFGENLLKARLRAHPDVAARHHADLLA